MSKFSFAARLVGLVSLLLAAFSASAQDAGPQADIPPLATEAPAPALIAQAVVPKAALTLPTPTVRRIELESIPDPKEGSTCSYKLKQGVKEDALTSRVVSVRPGLSYTVDWSSSHEGVTFSQYSRGGNSWDDYRARYRPQFRYPAVLGAEWQVLENYPRANGGFIRRNLIAKVTEVGFRVIPGNIQPVRVLGVRLEGHYAEHDPGGNGVYGNGRMWEEFILAPDIHCLVSYKGSIPKWNGSNYMSWELNLIGYDPGS